jgi:hypothetical protein
MVLRGLPDVSRVVRVHDEVEGLGDGVEVEEIAGLHYGGEAEDDFGVGEDAVEEAEGGLAWDERETGWFEGERV